MTLLRWPTGILALIVAAGAAWGAQKDIFDPLRPHVVEIRLDKKAWELIQPGVGARFAQKAGKSGHAPTTQVALRPGAPGYAYVNAQLRFDDKTITAVGVRFKGGFSYSVSAGSPRRPFKVDFDRFVDGQRLDGIETLNFQNEALDLAEARETLSFELFRKMGVPAPRTGYALLHLNIDDKPQYLGLYTLLEEVDRHFLKRNFTRSDGLLLKPAGMRGLAYFGENWNAYEGWYHSKGNVDPALARRVIELARLIHQADDATFNAKIESYLDVDEMLRYIAVGGALADFDSFLSTGHNYYLYVNPDDKRISIIPWDMNMAFGGYTWVGTTQQIGQLSILRPYVDHNLLIERLLGISRYREAYLAHVRRLVNGPFAPQTLQRRLDQLFPVFSAAGEAARKAGTWNSPSTRPVTVDRLHAPDLMDFVHRRASSIEAQLAGREPGYIPGFRDPDLVLAEWSRLVVPANALLDAMDEDGDGRVSEAEAAKAIQALLGQEKSLDPVRAAQAIEKLMTPQMRKAANARQWASWIIKMADRNKDGQVDEAELIRAYRHLLSSSDRDFDGQLGGREMIEGIGGFGPP